MFEMLVMSGLSAMTTNAIRPSPSMPSCKSSGRDRADADPVRGQRESRTRPCPRRDAGAVLRDPKKIGRNCRTATQCRNEAIDILPEAEEFRALSILLWRLYTEAYG